MSQQRSSPDEAVAASGRLLEHRMPVNGRQVMYATAAGGSASDTVINHARCGSGQAELTISADAGTSVTETRGSATGSGGSLPDSGERASRKDKRHNVEFARGSRDEKKKPTEISDLPQDIVQHILSFLTWQQVVGVRRVSRHWHDVADACLSRHTELRIGRFDFPNFLESDMLYSLLRAMPSLRCLSVNRRLRYDIPVDIVSRHCGNLVEVDLTMFGVDEFSLELMCRDCPGLEVVKLPKKSDDSCVHVLLRNLPKLRSLDLTNTNVTGRFLDICQDSVEKLSLAQFGSFFHGLAEDIARKRSQTACWSKMRELGMRKTDHGGHVDMSEMLKYFPALERLSLTGLSFNFSHLALCERLQDLDFSDVRLRCDDLLDVLTRCQLKRLSLAHSSITGSSSFGGLDQSLVLVLRELDVSCISGLAFATLRVILAHSPRLEQLRAAKFANMDLTACLAQLSRCPELREVDVSHLKTLHYLGHSADHDCKSRLVQSVILTALLYDCPKLERLLLAGCHITDSACLRHLAQCARLCELDLSRVTTVNAHNLALSRFESGNASDVAQGLSGCPALERLSVAGLKAPIEQMVPPTGLPRLTYLDVSDTKLTNNSLEHLPTLFPRLSTLSMAGCRMERDDDLVNYLSRLPHLHSLDIMDVPGVTDAMLDKLKTCRLTKLRISLNREISAEGIARMANGCRSLKLVWLNKPCDGIGFGMLKDINLQLSPHRARTVGFVVGYIDAAEFTLHIPSGSACCTLRWSDPDVIAL